VLPDSVLDRFCGRFLQRRLGKETTEISREQVAAAALCEMRIAGAIDGQIFFGSANHRLVALEDDVAIAPFF